MARRRNVWDAMRQDGDKAVCQATAASSRQCDHQVRAKVMPVTSRTLGDHVRRQRRALHSDVCCTGRADGPDARESAGLCRPFGYRLDWLRPGCVLDGWLCQSRPALGVLGPRFAAGLRVSVECGTAVEAREWRQQTGGSSFAAHSRPGVAGLCELSAFTVISARALHESPRGNGRYRFEPLSSRRGRTLRPVRAGYERRRGAIRHRCEQLSARGGRANPSGRGNETTLGRRANRGERHRQPAGPNGWGWHASGSERPQGQRRSRQADSACAGDDSFPGERSLSVSLLQFDWPAADRASCHVDDRHAVPGGCAPGIRKRRRSRYLRFGYAWR